MGKIVGNTVKAAVLLIGVPVTALFAYDTVAVRPHLAKIEAILAQADPQDASPPENIRDLIDANAGSPTSHAVRLATALAYSDPSQGQWHVRRALWGILLPMHLQKSQIYGLYSARAYNGTDRGLSNFARREYGKSLDQLSPMQAATTVAITHAPAAYLRDRSMLDKRARTLLAKSNAP